MAEAGLPVEVDLWFAMLAPAGTPPEIVVRYNKEIKEIIGTPQIREKLAKQGSIIVGGTPEQLAEFIARYRLAGTVQKLGNSCRTPYS